MNSTKIIKFLHYFLEYISKLGFRLSKDYANDAYDACKGVSMPSTGGFVIDSACAPYNHIYCNAERYLYFTRTIYLHIYNLQLEKLIIYF